MTVSREETTSAVEEDVNFRSAIELLGGSRVLRKTLVNRLELHDFILKGLPSAALLHLASHLSGLRDDTDFWRAIGVSVRTLQRRKEHPRPLSGEQGGRTWKFAEVLARAIRVFGSEDEAERWLKSNALALSNRRPIDLLATPTGIELVESLLTQLEYGVYV